MARVAILVPTCRRPQGLRRLLEGIERLDTVHDVRVIVADNAPITDADGGGAGLAVCGERAARYRFPLACLAVVEPGVAIVRNRLVEAAMADDDKPDFIAMIDDDEEPVPGWLDALVAMAGHTGAALVSGPVLPAFETPPPAWIERSRFFEYAMPQEGLVPMLLGTGNLLIATSVFATLDAPWFEPRLGLAGGEDDDFFLRAEAAGLRFAWAEDAKARETIPESRATLGWMRQRAYRTGNTWVNVRLRRRPGGWSRWTEIRKIAAALAVGSVLYMAGVATPEGRFAGERRILRAMGKIAALRGSFFEEYRTIHGS